MVQFGKTLNDVVKSDWRCHAVAYMELKRALSEQSDTTTNPTNNNCQPGIGLHKKCAINRCIGTINENYNNNDDVHSVHTESSYQITDKQKANYFRIYEDSIKRLTNFYENRVDWANDEKCRLEKAVERRMSDSEKNNGNVATADGCSDKSRIFRDTGDKKPEKIDVEDTTDSTSFLIHQITNFSRDLGLVLEFLELNTTAFSKIMKKYDKRTGSILREGKLKELKNTHPYLYDGGELKLIKVQCTEWIKHLQLILQKDVSMVVSHLRVPLTSSPKRASPSGRGSRTSSPAKSDSSSIVRLTEQNSFESGDTEDLVNIMPKLPFPGNSTEAGENPQESSEQIKGASKSPAARVGSPTVRFAADEKKKTASPHLVKPSLQTAPRSIHKTKEAQILEQMIDRVNEELCYQKADSPFFDTPLANEKQPPSFMSSEVQIAALLGQGEFCKIYEVSQFNVPESCHICFLHRGYNDPKPMSLKMKITKQGEDQPGHRKIPSSVIIDTSDISDEAKNVCIPVPTGVPLNQATQQPTTERWTTFNDDVSDYEDLEDDHEDDGFEHTTRGFMKDHCLRNSEARYAIKRIRSCLVGEEEITDAAIDLAREAEFLAALVHPNIIRIRGTINVPGHPKYAIILDRLYDTLEVQMRKWAVEVKSYQGKFKGLIGKNKRELKKKWTDRLVNAYDLARAMAYMHSRGILHRDIKPQNIGFDIRGDIKIFDFGLAKELKPIDKEGKDQFHTSGLAGTRRYMAPEVAQVMPYGLSSDVYSFGILLWEMLALKNAFEKYSREKHYKEVIVEGKRPKLVRSWPFATKNLIERCWAPHPLERPTFQAICELIKFALPNTLEDSERSQDLLLRSYRSAHIQPRKIGDSSPHPDDDSDHDPMESEIHSDSLSLSIRIKHKNHAPKATATPKTPIQE